MSATTATPLATAPSAPFPAPDEVALARPAAGTGPVGFLIGLVFGLLLALARLNEYDVIHNALMLRDPYVYLLMGSAVGTAVPLLWLLRRRRWRTPLGGPLVAERVPVERRHVYGSLVFGAGWAVTGACPAPALALAASGNVLGAVVVAGMFTGLLLRERWRRAR